MKDNCVSVTVDIEDWYHILSVTGSPHSRYRDVDQFFREWQGSRYDYLTGPTRRVLDLLDEFGVKATFFVVADVTERYPGLVEAIADRGHEIACHGLHHACKINRKTRAPLMEAEEFGARTREAREILERACGDDVIGYRAPNALVGGWMLDALRETGFRYDSSVCVNSLYNKSDSSLAGVGTSPYTPEKRSLTPGRKGEFVEFPWAYYDLGIKLPTSGGPMLRFLGANVILAGLKQSLRRGHTVFYFHPLDIASERFPRVGKGRPFYWSIKGKTVENRVRYVLKRLSEEGVAMKTMRSLYTEGLN
jgi:peptidoglycan/xylan/chitin deacetylase (PgdA/CDA1 family)